MTALRAMAIILCAALLPAASSFAVDIAVIGGLTRQAEVQPGGKVEGKIVLSNSGAKPQQAKVYQTDYMHFADGTAKYDAPGGVARSNAAWITFTPQQLEVPAGGSASVFYTIQVPEVQDLRGTYWSMLMVEPLTEESPELVPAGTDKPSVGIRTVMRYGIQMLTEVGKTGSCELKFPAKRLVAQDNDRALQVDVENVGERQVDPLVWAELYGADGISIGRFDGQRARIYPGCSARFEMNLSRVPAGPYTVLIVADNGDDHVFGTQAKLEIK